MIAASIPSDTEPEWTRLELEHPRGHVERGSAASVREALSLWSSPRMQVVRDVIKQAAPINVTVPVTGETGTGKELVARAVHHLGSRHNEPLVKVNCAAYEIKDAAFDGNRRATDRP